MTRIHLPYELRSQRVVDFISTYTRRYGYSPTVREIAEAVGYASAGSTHKLLKKMEGDGLVESAGLHVARTTRLPNMPIAPPRDRRNEL
jgi:SOS-response transcriptional repressor LexA